MALVKAYEADFHFPLIGWLDDVRASSPISNIFLNARRHIIRTMISSAWNWSTTASGDGSSVRSTYVRHCRRSAGITIV